MIKTFGSLTFWYHPFRTHENRHNKYSNNKSSILFKHPNSMLLPHLFIGGEPFSYLLFHYFTEKCNQQSWSPHTQSEKYSFTLWGPVSCALSDLINQFKCDYNGKRCYFLLPFLIYFHTQPSLLLCTAMVWYTHSLIMPYVAHIFKYIFALSETSCIYSGMYKRKHFSIYPFLSHFLLSLAYPEPGIIH